MCNVKLQAGIIMVHTSITKYIFQWHDQVYIQGVENKKKRGVYILIKIPDNLYRSCPLFDQRRNKYKRIENLKKRSTMTLRVIIARNRGHSGSCIMPFDKLPEYNFCFGETYTIVLTLPYITRNNGEVYVLDPINQPFSSSKSKTIAEISQKLKSEVFKHLDDFPLECLIDFIAEPGDKYEIFSVKSLRDEIHKRVIEKKESTIYFPVIEAYQPISQTGIKVDWSKNKVENEPYTSSKEAVDKIETALKREIFNCLFAV